MTEIRFIKRAYCLWCHGYPVITHSMAAPPLFALKPRRDSLPPKSNQLPSPPHIHLWYRARQAAHFIVNNHRWQRQGNIWKEAVIGIVKCEFHKVAHPIFRIEIFLPGLLLRIHSHPDPALFQEKIWILTLFEVTSENCNRLLTDWIWVLRHKKSVIVAIVSLPFPLAQTAHEWKIYFLNWKWFHLWPCSYHHVYETMICVIQEPPAAVCSQPEC